jgi:TolA-binding protein
VVERPVVDDETLAHALYLSERYDKAAELYRRLHTESPDQTHLLLMLVLSERNAGNHARAAALLEELKSKSGASEWAQWMEEMTALGCQEEQETE